MVALSRVAEIQLGKMLQPAPSSSFDRETTYLRAGSLSGLGDGDELPRMWCSPSDIQKYSLRQGDLLVAEGGDVGRTEFAPELSEPTVIQNSLHRVRTSSNDIRFLRYGIENIYNSGWLDVVCNKSTFGHLTVDKLSSLQIPRPTFAVQRAIADYLAAETARIDALIAKKQRLRSLITDRLAGRVEIAVRTLAASWPPRPLKRSVSTVQVGIVITPAAWYSDSGVLALRGVNVKPGRLDLEDVVSITDEGHQIHAKSVLHAGDVVVVRTGKAGAAAVIPEELDGCNCIDLVIVRPSGQLLPDYLELVLNSNWTQQHIEEHSVGTIQSHFNVESMKELPLPVPSIDVQRVTLNEINRLALVAIQLDALLEEQLILLAERRQALITAAVTGHLDIPEIVHGNH
jgi:type I restriction enzyme S subunit